MYCPKCGKPNDDNAYRCTTCGEVIQVVPAATYTYNVEDDAALRMVLPIGRSGLAIAAGYVGLISVLLFPAPFAILLSILAISE